MNPNPLTLTISADKVAWYGAVVATLGTIVQVLNFLRDKKSAKVTYQTNLQIGDGRILYEPGLYLRVKVVNVGRRPFTLSYVGLQYDNGIGVAFGNSTPALPCELREGQSLTVLTKQDGIHIEKILWF